MYFVTHVKSNSGSKQRFSLLLTSLTLNTMDLQACLNLNFRIEIFYSIEG